MFMLLLGVTPKQLEKQETGRRILCNSLASTCSPGLHRVWREKAGGVVIDSGTSEGTVDAGL